ncbi:hypothetical protein Tco_1494816 [Tanacetum coccineum]
MDDSIKCVGVLDGLCKEIVKYSNGIEKDSDCVMVLDDDYKENESRTCGMNDDMKVKTSKSEVDGFVSDEDIRWEDEDKDLNLFDYDSDVYSLSTKALAGEKKLFVNKKREEDLDKVIPCFARMATETWDWLLVLRTTDIWKLEMIRIGMEIKRKLSDVDATINEGNLGHFKFDIWKWPKRKKTN